MRFTAGLRKVFWAIILCTATGVFAKPPAGKTAPEFSLIGFDSTEKVKLSDFKGKVVLLDFWASWCLPCKKLLPMVADMKSRYPDLQVLAVSIDVDRNKAISFLRSVETGLKAAHDADQKTAAAYAVEWMPTSFLIDKRGRLRFRHDSYTERDLA